MSSATRGRLKAGEVFGMSDVLEDLERLFPPTVESEKAKLKEYKKLSKEMIDNLVAENERLKKQLKNSEGLQPESE